MSLSANLLPCDGEAFLCQLLTSEESEKNLQSFIRRLSWKKEKIFIFGREVFQPRLSAWFGGEGRSYFYSGLSLEPKPWDPELFKLKELVEKVAQVEFNSALLNLYRDGRDSMGWHRDNEKELGPEPVIASLSLGAKRKFNMRHREKKELKVSMTLGGGELLVMRGLSQHKWEHSVPKTAKQVDPRLNITFRNILGSSE